jgi:hypothetical protein
MANWPKSAIMHLKIRNSMGAIQRSSLDVPGNFVLKLELPPGASEGMMIWEIETHQGFMPAKFNKESDDTRSLSFQVSRIELGY